MTQDSGQPKKRKKWRKWVSMLFPLWGIFAFWYMWDTFQTKDVDPEFLKSSVGVRVEDGKTGLEFLPVSAKSEGLVFICGSGVDAPAYAPLLRPIAEMGYPVVVVKLPGRFAMGKAQKEQALVDAKALMDGRPDVKKWVVAGHSLGGALSCKFVQADPGAASALVLVGTTHPKEDALSGLDIPVAKVYGSDDGVAPVGKIEANKSLLPAATEYVLIDGANHSQFGNYGHQLQDGKATISRVDQQGKVRAVLVKYLELIGR